MESRATDWKRIAVSELCESIIDCVNKTAPTVEGPTPFRMIRTTNVKNGWVNTSTVNYVDEETYQKWIRRGAPRCGDVILTREAPLGEVGLLRDDDGVFLGQRLVMYRANPEKLNNRFLLYSLLSHEVQSQIKSFGSGATVEHMRVPDCEKIEISVPPLPTQRKIAAILSAYDDLIENNLRRIKILEEMAQNLYREWFVKFRFPGHQTARFVDSPLGRIPEGWKVVKLDSLIEIRKGKNITKNTVVQGSVPVVAGGMSPAYFHNASNTQQPVITISASGANAGFICLYHENVWASDCSVIDLHTTPYVYFFYLQLKYRHTEVTGLQRGSAQPHVYPKDLMDLDAVNVPGILLDKFSEKVTPIFQMIKNLTLKNTTLRRTRDLLLPKLISGEVDVSELDITIPEEAV